MIQDLSREQSRRGTRKLMLGTAIVGVVLAVAVVVWPLLPGPELGTPRNYEQERANVSESAAGQKSNQGSGQSTVGMAAPTAPEDGTGAKARAIQGSAEPLALTSQQREELRAYFRQGAHRVDRADFSISIGSAVPRQVELRLLPPQASAILGAASGAEYIIVRDQLVLVEPEARRVVAIIPGIG